MTVQSTERRDVGVRQLLRTATVAHCHWHNPRANPRRRNATPLDVRATIASHDIAWPMTQDQVQSLTALYPGTPVLLPPDIVAFRDAPLDDSALRDILAPLQPQPHAYTYELAHLAIDVVGDSGAIVSSSPPPNTFGTLVYFLASDCSGGAITISCGNDELLVATPSNGDYVAFYNTTTVSVAPIDAGHRTVAVYHLMYKEGRPTLRYRWAPPPMPSIDDLRRAVAQLTESDIVFSTPLQAAQAEPVFSALVGRDKTIADWLAFSGCLDVALVRKHAASRRHEANGVLHAAFHPACKTPSALLDACRASNGVVLRDAPRETPHGHCYLVCWPHSRRVHVLGFDSTLALLRANVAGDIVEHLGYGSLIELASMALPLGANPVPSSAVSAPTQSALASVLWQIGDVELMRCFVTRSWWGEGHVAAVNDVTEMAAHVVQCMQTPTLLHQLRCHIAFRVCVLATLVRHYALSAWLPNVLDGDWSSMQTGLRSAVFLTTAMPTLEAALEIDAWCMDRTVKPGVHAVLDVLLPFPLVDSIVSYVYAPPLLTALSHHSQLQASLPLFLWQHQTPKLSSWHVYLQTAVCYVAANGCKHDAAIAALLLLTAGTLDFMVVRRAATSSSQRLCHLLGAMRGNRPTSPQVATLRDVLADARRRAVEFTHAPSRPRA